MRVCLELNRTQERLAIWDNRLLTILEFYQFECTVRSLPTLYQVTLKTKSEWPSTFVEVSKKDGDKRYKTFILDRARGIKLIKNLKNGKKSRVKSTCLANGRWKLMTFSQAGAFVAILQQDVTKQVIIKGPTLDMNKSHSETSILSPSNHQIMHINRNDKGVG